MGPPPTDDEDHVSASVFSHAAGERHQSVGMHWGHGKTGVGEEEEEGRL